MGPPMTKGPSKSVNGEREMTFAQECGDELINSPHIMFSQFRVKDG
jgi:hypothetical protein